MSILNPRSSRVLAGFAVLSAFAVVPVAAQAGTAVTSATGTLSSGGLTNTAPSIGSLSTALTGISQTKTADVGGWSVNDATGTNAAYFVTVAATAPTVGGSAPAAGTGGSLTLTKTSAIADAANSAATGPLPSAGATMVLGSAATIATAVATTGQGKWDFAAATAGLSVVIPGNASAGTYLSTLTYTSAPTA